MSPLGIFVVGDGGGCEGSCLCELSSATKESRGGGGGKQKPTIGEKVSGRDCERIFLVIELPFVISWFN